ncbi:MAG: UDP-glucose 4-epimerase GalE [Gracilibacteraceae bacterium]|jgi:UDP-glucose 4-epimerase|nr:UDP-glucose 4-epimerase GalE [Gracilibacteraceae bacterium]
MAILVTGGAGYIGSHICVELLRIGEDVIVLDNFSNAKPEVIGRIKQIAGRDFPARAADVRHEAAVRQVFADYDVEAVIHLAGLKAVGESQVLPLRYYQHNVAGALVLCAAMQEAGCKTLVFSSSATVYGAEGPVPFREDHPLSAVNPYGRTKIMIEQILRDLHASDSAWRIASLRYFNPIGAHESGLIGEDPLGTPNNLLPCIAQVAAGRRPRLTVYGGDYDTADGAAVRDYVHVADLAQGHVSALTYLRGYTGAEAFNLGTGRGYSVLELVSAFAAVSGRPIPYVIAPRRAGDIAVCYADAAKAEKILGWRTRRSLRQMCADAWRFTRTMLETAK